MFLTTLLCVLLSCCSASKLLPGKLPKSFVESLPNPPPWQVHAYNNNTFILRQSGFTDSEKPFLYLLFGDERVYLFDTGSLNGHPTPVIRRIIVDYLSSKAAPSSLELVIGHSHSHWDHTAGDQELANFTITSLNVTSKLIAPGVPSVVAGYALSNWPHGMGTLDLGGGRVLDIIPLPGHTDDAIAIYDRQTGLLLTGDSVYPGRIYIPQSAIQTFKDSHRRLLHFVASREVSHVLGCHIEQKQTPFEEYPVGAKYQPHEHVLQLPVSILGEMGEALRRVSEDGKIPRQYMFAEFSLVIPEVKDESILQLQGWHDEGQSLLA